jgi:hypothetical protein
LLHWDTKIASLIVGRSEAGQDPHTAQSSSATSCSQANLAQNSAQYVANLNSTISITARHTIELQDPAAGWRSIASINAMAAIGITIKTVNQKPSNAPTNK